MAFTPVQVAGRAVTEARPKKASTAISMGAFVEMSSGVAQPVTSSSTKAVGLIMRSVASTDSDYASTPATPIALLSTDSVVRCLYTGTAPTVGGQYDFSDSVTINGSGTSHKAVTCVGGVDTTSSTALFKLSSSEAVQNGS